MNNQPGLQETYFLKTKKDVEKFLSLPLPEISGDVSPFFRLLKRIVNQGIIYYSLGVNPGGYAVSLFGSEQFAIATIIEREMIHLLLERRMKIMQNLVKFLVDKGVGLFFCMAGEEYITPPLHGPKDFWDFNVKYDKPIVDLIHDAGGYIYIHCHGSVNNVLDGFIQIGTDMLHPLEAPPMGDITALEAKRKMKDNCCMKGNIQIADLYQKSSKNIREQVYKLIEDVFYDHKGLVVSPTASPYVYGKGELCWPKYKIMIDSVLRFN